MGSLYKGGGGKTITTYYILANKILSIRNGLSLLELMASWGLIKKQTLLAMSIAFGHLPEVDNKALLLKLPHS